MTSNKEKKSMSEMLKENLKETIHILRWIYRNLFIESFVLSKYPNEAWGKVIPRIFIVYFAGMLMLFWFNLSILYTLGSLWLLLFLTYLEDTYVRSKNDEKKLWIYDIYFEDGSVIRRLFDHPIEKYMEITKPEEEEQE